MPHVFLRRARRKPRTSFRSFLIRGEVDLESHFHLLLANKVDFVATSFFQRASPTTKRSNACSIGDGGHSIFISSIFRQDETAQQGKENQMCKRRKYINTLLNLLNRTSCLMPQHHAHKCRQNGRRDL
jgi:hypothetical protein